jgi:TPR repeat protein
LLDWRLNPCYPTANYALGVCYHDGVGCAGKDPVKAVYYYQRSADAGQPRGEGILGYCYGEGFGVPKDVTRAFHFYVRAAEKGESVSMYNVAHCEYVQSS